METKRRDRGSGSVSEAYHKSGPKAGKRKTKDGLKGFEVQIRLGSGKRISRTVYATCKSKAAAQISSIIDQYEAELAAEEQRRAEAELALATVGARTFKAYSGDSHFNEAAGKWLSSRVKSATLSDKTIEDNRRYIKLLCRKDYLRDMPVSAILPHVVEDVYHAIKKEKIEKSPRHTCSGSTMRQIHIVLNMVMEWCVDNDMIVKNPCKRVKKPKQDKSRRDALSFREGTRLLVALDSCINDEIDVVLASQARKANRPNSAHDLELRSLTKLSCLALSTTAMRTGMRRGELLALTWSDVNITVTDKGIRGHVKVSKSMQADRKVKCPKTESGYRRINLDKECATLLHTIKSVQAVALAKIEQHQTCTTPVFCSNVGDYIWPHNFAAWWRSWRTDNGFEDLKLHELRHTHASHLAASGVDLETIKTRLGWSDISMLNIYGHGQEENDIQAAEITGSLYHATA